MKGCLIVIIIVISFFLAYPATASPCYSYQGLEICVLKIKRSAKYYWEYRTQIKVNGVIYPPEIYNCRTRIKTQQNGQKVGFQEGDAGEFICQKLSRLQG